MATLPFILAGAAAGGGLGALTGGKYNYRGGPSQIGNSKFNDPRTEFSRNLYDPMYADWYNYAFGPEQQQITDENRDMWAGMWGDRSRYQQQGDYLYGDDASDSQYYRPQEIENMRRYQERYGAQTTPEEYANMYLSPEEQQAMGGDPYAAYNRFRDEASGMQRDLDIQEGRTFDSLAEQERNLRGAGDQYRQGAGRVLDRGGRGMRDAAYSEDLAMDPTLRGSQMGRVGETATGVRGMHNDPNILASRDFMDNYKFGPEDTKDLEHLASSTVGNRYQSEVEDIGRKAAASGNSSPMALAALRERSNRNAAKEASDASVGARVQGRGMELETTRGREDVRLGAAQNRARLGSSNELALGDMALGEGRNLEQMRLGAEANRRGMQMTAEDRLMQSELGNERDQAGFNADNERYLGTSRLGAYSGLGNARQRQGEFIAGTGAGLTQHGESEASRRAGENATNRQQTQRYTAGQRYNQGRETANDMSDIERRIADQRLGFGQERRGYVAGQQAGAQSGALTSMGQRQNFYGQRGNLRNQASSNLGQYDLGRRQFDFNTQTPSRGQRAIAGAVGGALGAGRP